MIGTCDLQSLTSSITETTDPARLKELLASARLALRIFYSMNSPGLTEVPHHPLCGSSAPCWKCQAPGPSLGCLAWSAKREVCSRTGKFGTQHAEAPS